MSYVSEILRLYLELSDTPNQTRPLDRKLAAQLQQQQIPIKMVKAAFLLGAARRATRDPSYPSLQPIRSLHYFLPILEEIRRNPFDPAYIDYLENWSPQFSDSQ
jgi:hypothetical protein